MTSLPKISALKGKDSANETDHCRERLIQSHTPNTQKHPHPRKKAVEWKGSAGSINNTKRERSKQQVRAGRKRASPCEKARSHLSRSGSQPRGKGKKKRKFMTQVNGKVRRAFLEKLLK